MDELLPLAPDDGALVERARAGDSLALDVLVARHHGAVYRLALVLVSEPDVAADVTQDTFVRALKALPGYRGDASFRTWLLAIAGNEARGVLRRGKRRREEPLDPAVPLVDGDDTEGGVFRRLEAERIQLMLPALPPKQRMAVLLRIFDGLSFREVGDAIGSSEGAARVNYFHGIGRLRALLDGD